MDDSTSTVIDSYSMTPNNDNSNSDNSIIPTELKAMIGSGTSSSDLKSFSETIGSNTYKLNIDSANNIDTFTTRSSSIYTKAYTQNEANYMAETKVAYGSSTILDTNYTYDPKGLIKEYKNLYSNGSSNLTYTYDKFGNIATISLNGIQQYHYYYDVANELTRVDDSVQNLTLTYTYDSHGNITSRITYPYTTESDLTGLTASSTINYGYGNEAFQDEMTSYNGQTIEYDALGNPLNYLGWNMTWTAGRELESMSNGSDNLSYQYDDNGIRTSKTVDGIKTTYTSVGGRITSQSDGTNAMYFRYDKNNQLVGFNLNGTEYVYEMNGQGDVVGILDDTGNKIVSYTYDAWGKCNIASDNSEISIGNTNPMRYRGYYLDDETGFYYLQSRYYDPGTCRFLNADDVRVLGLCDGEVLGANLFAYCSNNAVNFIDPSGFGRISVKAFSKIITVVMYALQIGSMILTYRAWVKMAKLIAERKMKNIKKKVIHFVMDNIGTVTKLTIGVTINFTYATAELLLDLILDWSIGYAIAWIVYQYVPYSHKFLYLYE